MAKLFRKRPSKMAKNEFLAVFGRIYEHSPWVAEQLWEQGLNEALDDIEAFHAAMAKIVESASRDHRLGLLNAHPDLAGKLAMQGELTAESTGEQASAGLDKCSPEEFGKFTRLNQAYRTRFGFPFIMAVRGKTRSEILASFERRVANDQQAEFETAMAEVHKIALLRLLEL